MPTTTITTPIRNSITGRWFLQILGQPTISYAQSSLGQKVNFSSRRAAIKWGQDAGYTVVQVLDVL